MTAVMHLAGYDRGSRHGPAGCPAGFPRLMTAACIDARCGGDPALSVGRAAHGTRNRRRTTAHAARLLSTTSSRPGRQTRRVEPRHKPARPIRLLGVHTTARLRASTPGRNRVPRQRRLRIFDLSHLRAPVLGCGNAHHHTVRRLPVRSIGSRAHEFEVPESVRSCKSHFCVFHFRCLMFQSDLSGAGKTKARRRCSRLPGLRSGKNRFGYRMPSTARARHGRSTQPTPARPWRSAKACNLAAPAKASGLTLSRDTSVRTSIGRIGMVAGGFPVVSVMVRPSFRHTRAREMRAPRRSPNHLGRKLPKWEGMRPSDSSADPPAECLPVGGYFVVATSAFANVRCSNPPMQTRESAPRAARLGAGIGLMCVVRFIGLRSNVLGKTNE